MISTVYSGKFDLLCTSTVTITAHQTFRTFLNSVNMGQMPISIFQGFSTLPPELNAPSDMQRIRIQMWAA